MASWSLKSNLALNPVKTKSMLLLTSQMNLKQNDHVEDIANASYGVLRGGKIKHFTDFHLRKRLAESLVLSRLDYCASVYLPLPGYLLKRLQKIEFAAASFVYDRYVNDKAQLAPS